MSSLLPLPYQCNAKELSASKLCLAFWDLSASKLKVIQNLEQWFGHCLEMVLVVTVGGRRMLDI